MKYEYEIPKEIPTSPNGKDYRGVVQGKVLIHHPCDRETTAEKRNKHLLWLCECECGVMFTARAGAIAEKRLSSCGRCEKVNAALLRHLPEIPRKQTQLEMKFDTPPSAVNQALAHLESSPNDHEAIDKLLSAIEEDERPPSFDVPLATMGNMPPALVPGKLNETDVVGVCSDALSHLGKKACKRVLKYLMARHGG